MWGPTKEQRIAKLEKAVSGIFDILSVIADDMEKIKRDIKAIEKSMGPRLVSNRSNDEATK